MITFDRLWKTLDEKGVTQYKLITYYDISRGQISRLKHNKNVNTHTIDKLCRILDCTPMDIIEYTKDKEVKETRKRKKTSKPKPKAKPETKEEA